MTESPTILTLPPELTNLIHSYLSWRDLTTLRLTHRHFSETCFPVGVLSSLHSAHQALTHAAELQHLRSTLGYSNANWTGFTQGWGLSPRISLCATLPCYHCLRWLSSADARLETSAFSRAMATGKRDLGMEKARTRVCVDCGVRCGLYAKGNRVKHQAVCFECGGLGVPVRREEYSNERSEAGSGLLKGHMLRWHWYCKKCVDSGKAPWSRIEFEHERMWGRYEKAMMQGKIYRDEKGRRLRMERGIEDKKRGKLVDEVYVPKHQCPILGENRLCGCWKTGDDRPPDWVLTVQKSHWKW